MLPIRIAEKPSLIALYGADSQGDAARSDFQSILEKIQSIHRVYPYYHLNCCGFKARCFKLKSPERRIFLLTSEKGTSILISKEIIKANEHFAFDHQKHINSGLKRLQEQSFELKTLDHCTEFIDLNPISKQPPLTVQEETLFEEKIQTLVRRQALKISKQGIIECFDLWTQMNPPDRRVTNALHTIVNATNVSLYFSSSKQDQVSINFRLGTGQWYSHHVTTPNRKLLHFTLFETVINGVEANAIRLQQAQRVILLSIPTYPKLAFEMLNGLGLSTFAWNPESVALFLELYSQNSSSDFFPHLCALMQLNNGLENATLQAIDHFVHCLLLNNEHVPNPVVQRCIFSFLPRLTSKQFTQLLQMALPHPSLFEKILHDASSDYFQEKMTVVLENGKENASLISLLYQEYHRMPPEEQNIYTTLLIKWSQRLSQAPFAQHIEDTPRPMITNQTPSKTPVKSHPKEKIDLMKEISKLEHELINAFLSANKTQTDLVRIFRENSEKFTRLLENYYGRNQNLSFATEEENCFLNNLEKEKNNLLKLNASRFFGGETLIRITNFLKEKRPEKLTSVMSPCIPNAAEYGRTNLLRFLLLNNCTVDYILENGATALYLVCANFQDLDESITTAVLKLLLAAGANPNITTEHHWTPLTIALNRGQYACAEILIKNGAHVNQGLILESNGVTMTPLDFVIRRSNEGIIQLLVKSGARTCNPLCKINAIDTGFKSTSITGKKVKKDRKKIDQLNRCYRTFVMRFCGICTQPNESLSSLSDVLMKPPFYLSFESYLLSGETFLHYAINQKCPHLVRELIEVHNQSVHRVRGRESEHDGMKKIVFLKNNRGETPLHTAVLTGQLDIVDLLLENGADVEARNEDDRTPILSAIAQKRLDIIDRLLHSNANLKATTEKKESANSIAKQHQDPSFTKAILEKFRGQT